MHLLLLQKIQVQFPKQLTTLVNPVPSSGPHKCTYACVHTRTYTPLTHTHTTHIHTYKLNLKKNKTGYLMTGKTGRDSSKANSQCAEDSKPLPPKGSNISQGWGPHWGPLRTLKIKLWHQGLTSPNARDRNSHVPSGSVVFWSRCPYGLPL